MSLGSAVASSVRQPVLAAVFAIGHTGRGACSATSFARADSSIQRPEERIAHMRCPRGRTHQWARQHGSKAGEGRTC
jgi:hypothetical protein